MAKKRPSGVPIGDVLRQRRAEVLKKGLREMARELNIAPAHLTDVELGRRSPSEDLMMRISRCYGIPEADLRAGWSKPEAIVEEVASKDAMTAAKVPALLRTARNLTSQQWDSLIQQAERMAADKNRKPKG